MANGPGFPIDTAYEPILSRQDLAREFSDSQASERSRKAALKVVDTIGSHQNDEGPTNIILCEHVASCLGIGEAFGGYGYVGYSSFSHFQGTMLLLDKKNISISWETKFMGDVRHLSEEHQKPPLTSAY